MDPNEPGTKTKKIYIDHFQNCWFHFGYLFKNPYFGSSTWCRRKLLQNAEVFGINTAVKGIWSSGLTSVLTGWCTY